jgi:hypothetical protein
MEEPVPVIFFNKRQKGSHVLGADRLGPIPIEVPETGRQEPSRPVPSPREPE